MMLTAPITYWWSFQIMNAMLGLSRDRYDALYHKFLLMAAMVESLFLVAAVGCAVWPPVNIPPGEFLFYAFLTFAIVLSISSTVARRNLAEVGLLQRE